MSSWEYVSVTPAVDWFAMFDDGEHVVFEQIVCWAIAEDSDGKSCVVGMVVETDCQDLAPAGSSPYFAGYFSRKQLDTTLVEIDEKQRKTLAMN